MRPSVAAPALIALLTIALPSSGQTLPAGFQDAVVLSGLTFPMAVRFAPDGRVFVAEKSGLIKVFDSLQDPTPTVFADLRPQVMDYWDRGLLGLAIDPNFPRPTVRTFPTPTTSIRRPPVPRAPMGRLLSDASRSER
jgi:hypothetical protein